MGQQQMLLVVLSVIIVGTSVAIGIVIFDARIQTTNREAIIQDIYEIAFMVIAFNKMPASQGGGAGNWNVSKFYQYCSYPLTPNGKYFQTENGSIMVDDYNGSIRVKGWGTEIGSDDNTKVRARVLISDNRIDEKSFLILN